MSTDTGRVWYWHPWHTTWLASLAGSCSYSERRRTIELNKPETEKRLRLARFRAAKLPAYIRRALRANNGVWRLPPHQYDAERYVLGAWERSDIGRA